MAVKQADQLGAGDLKSKVRFEARGVADDGYGNEVTSFAPQFTRSAYIGALQGGEAVMAGRLQSRQPLVIVVRSDSETRTIKEEWRAVEILGDGTEHAYAIRTAEDMDRQRRWVTMLCEAGVAA